MFKKINRKNKKGFTLAELLIVVAIIGVLVAVSIPIFTAQLEKSREATDLANLRAAKSEAVSMYLLGDSTLGLGDWGTGKQSANVKVYYDAPNGKLCASTAKPTTTYGKGTATDGGNSDSSLNYTGTTDASGKVIAVTVTTDGACSFTWE